MNRSRLTLVALVALPGLALLGGCQLLIGLDGGKPGGGGAGGTGSSSSSTTTSSSTTSSSTTTSSTSSGTGAGGSGGHGGMPGTGGMGGATSSSTSSTTTSSSSGASCDGGTTCSQASDCDDPAHDCVAAACDTGCCGAPQAKAVDTACATAGGKVCGTGATAGMCVDCNTPAQCASKVCTGNVCQAPSCSDNVQNGAETGVDCGPGCVPCPAVLLLAGGAPGPSGVLAGAYPPGGTWSSMSLAGTTAEVAVAFVPTTGDGIGVVRSTAPANKLQYTRLSATTWSALQPINSDSAQGQPALIAVGNTAHLVFWNLNFKHDHEAWSAGAWTAAAQPVTPLGSAVQPCGPNAPALALLGAEVSVVFVNGNCTGALNHLLGTDLVGGVWQATKDVASDPAYDAAQRPAIAALVGTPELVVAYVPQGTQQIWSAHRSSGVWSAPAMIANGLTNDPIALAPLASGGAVLAYRGTDAGGGKLYTATFTGAAWSTPVGAFTPNVVIGTTPAVARGVGTAKAELAYVDGNGVVFHTRLVGTTWTPPLQVATGTGFTRVALASGP